MKRISNAFRIADIEYVIGSPPPSPVAEKWSAYGAQCIKQRLQFSGENFGVLIDVINLSMSGKKDGWSAALVTEAWHFTEAKQQPKVTKSLKLIRGKSSELVTWMQTARSTKLNETNKRNS